MRHVILSRPQHQAEDFAKALQRRISCPILIAPLVEIENLHVDNPKDFDGVIFTSANGVRSVPPQSDLIAICVGDTTTQVAAEMGYDAISASGTSGDLAHIICGSDRFRSLRWFHPHGVQISDVLAKLLRAEGVDYQAAVTYRQNERAWTKAEADIALKEGQIFPVFSPASADRLTQSLGDDAQNQVFVAISEDTAERLPRVNAASIRIADKPDRHSMLDAIAQEFARLE